MSLVSGLPGESWTLSFLRESLRDSTAAIAIRSHDISGTIRNTPAGLVPGGFNIPLYPIREPSVRTSIRL